MADTLVESITLFQTTLTHPDRSRVIIPNRKFPQREIRMSAAA
jgi:small-conductance mechanosensitive channel